MRRVLLSAIALSLLAAAPPRPAPNVNPPVTVTVDAAANRHPIDDRIYSVAWADSATIADLSIPINRWGGNAASRYNWAISTTNRCKDFYFENILDNVAGDGTNGESADDFIKLAHDNAQTSLITIPMMGLLPKDQVRRCGYSIAKYGPQDGNDAQFMPDCGSGKRLDHSRILNNDPADTAAVYPSSHQGDWIQHIVNTWGNAQAGGVKYYALDNEPVLWSFDHWDIHPTGSTYDEVWSKMQAYGAIIKAKDPTSLTTGIEEWGWDGYFRSGLDAENNNTADRLAHGDVPYAEWLLQQARAYEETTGTRILDFATVHFYPQSGEFSDPNEDTAALQGLRNRSTRSLWDPSYQDESWIGGTQPDNGHVQLIPRLKQWVINNYPGTHVGITEYNWGDEDHINGATAQADILGIFGREGLDLGVRWTSPTAGSPVYNAFKMYRNYDGLHSRFGDLSVSATGVNADELATFAALRSSDRAMTVMVINKTTDSTPVTVNLSNYAPGVTAQRWQLDAANAIARIMPDVGVAGASLSVTVPAQSITLFVIPGSYVDAPTGTTASATSGSTTTVSWNAVGGATYQVYRSDHHADFAPVGAATAMTTFNDSALTADTTYLYRVRAISGGVMSGMSNVDAATTTTFTNDPLTAGTVAAAAHITQLRTAVNAMCAAGGVTAKVFTDTPLNSGAVIKRIHIVELRQALNQARAAIGLPPVVYTDPAITAGTTTMKVAHIVDLRNGVK
jgi:hypothetical protein